MNPENGWFIIPRSQTGVAHFAFFDEVSYTSVGAPTICGRLLPYYATPIDPREIGSHFCSFCRIHTRANYHAWPGETESQRYARVVVRRFEP